MTYVYETQMGGKALVVEYVHSSVTDSIKVVDMTADGKFHRLNWMNDYGRETLLAELEEDMTDRMCQTGAYAPIPVDEDEVDVITAHLAEMAEA
tara:strand:+ start:740 stop:1021 length:282 start_codon:yes stop_codon:yes gene_type:complete